MDTAVAELTMPMVEYGKDDDELLNQPMKKYKHHHETSEEVDDGYSIVVTVPGDACSVTSVFLCKLKSKCYICVFKMWWQLDHSKCGVITLYENSKIFCQCLFSAWTLLMCDRKGI